MRREEERKDTNMIYNDYEKKIIELDKKKSKLEKLEKELNKLEKDIGKPPKPKISIKKKKKLSAFLIVVGIVVILWTTIIFVPENIPLGFGIFVTIMTLIFTGVYMLGVENEYAG